MGGSDVDGNGGGCACADACTGSGGLDNKIKSTMYAVCILKCNCFVITIINNSQQQKLEISYFSD